MKLSTVFSFLAHWGMTGSPAAAVLSRNSWVDTNVPLWLSTALLTYARLVFVEATQLETHAYMCATAPVRRAPWRFYLRPQSYESGIDAIFLELMSPIRTSLIEPFPFTLLLHTQDTPQQVSNVCFSLLHSQSRNPFIAKGQSIEHKVE